MTTFKKKTAATTTTAQLALKLRKRNTRKTFANKNLISKAAQ